MCYTVTWSLWVGSSNPQRAVAVRRTVPGQALSGGLKEWSFLDARWGLSKNTRLPLKGPLKG